MIATIVGAGVIADVFFVAFKFPNFFRRMFAEGAFTAAKWLMNKKPGLYSMRNVLNFK